ncbi:MAG TPA: amidohydrolase family protein [Candidatus Limnocylindrales bacterium]
MTRIDVAMTSLPFAPPFRLRARILTPLATGATRYLADGAVDVDARGRISRVEAWPEAGAGEGEPAPGAGVQGANPTAGIPVHDVRPWLVMPGLVDLHTHIPQLPNAGLGAGLDLLTWLERYTFPLERRFDATAAERLGPLAMRAFTAAGTTTLVAYASADPDATEVLLRSAETHGIRAVIGLVLMDRAVGVERGAASSPDDDAGIRASAALSARWNGRDDGRLHHAFTPRFAPSCSSGMLRESARLAAESGSLWQTHLSEDPGELDAVRAAFPEARDYLDVYDRAGALGPGGPRALFAHAIHLSEREIRRLAESGAGVAHCPASNLFLPSGIMPLARYLEAGIPVGLGSDVSGGPDPSIFEVMRVGAYAQHALQAVAGDRRPALDPLGWLRLGTLGGAVALGLGDTIGSLEPGKEADMIAIDASLTEPIPGAVTADEPAEIVSRLIFRTHPQMVRGAWVRGRLLPA